MRTNEPWSSEKNRETTPEIWRKPKKQIPCPLTTLSVSVSAVKRLEDDHQPVLKLPRELHDPNVPPWDPISMLESAAITPEMALNPTDRHP